MAQSPGPLLDGERALLARAGLGLAIIGASSALFLESLTGRWLGPFVANNALSERQRGQLLVALALGALVGLVAAAALYWPARERDGLQRLSRVARLLAPLGLLGLLPSLLVSDGWPDALTLALTLSAFLLALQPLWRMHFDAYAGLPPDWLAAVSSRVPPWWRRHGVTLAVAGAAIVYIAYASFFAVRNHHRFNTYTWDLGQIDNQFYNFLHGHPFRCTVLIRGGNWSELRNHAEAVMAFLLPVYALHPAAETLLVMQAALLGLGGVCLYRFAARRLPPPTALALTVAYYLYPPLHGAQFFDIHFQPVAAAFLLAAIDCFDARRMRLFTVFFVLAITCREDISVGTAVFGLFLILTGHRVRAGAAILAVSLIYFVALRFVIMPAVGAWGFAEHYKQLFPPDGARTFAGIIKTIVSNPLFTWKTFLGPDKLRFILQILAPLAFLPLRRIYLAMSVLPGAYFTLLTTGYSPTLDISYQYGCFFVPYIFPAAALALAAMANAESSDAAAIARRRAAVATMLVGTLVATAHWGAIPPRHNFHLAYGDVMNFDPPTVVENQRRQDIHALDALVPRDAVLAATDRELPHVSNRLQCWNFSTGYQGSDYVLFGTTRPIQSEIDQLRAAERAGYTRIAERPGLLLLRRPGVP
ncbi:MAG TPA: DUF2079 domain-containing protein [Polyangia bacterium]|jgi:uncharacterized membrane protein